MSKQPRTTSPRRAPDPVEKAITGEFSPDQFAALIENQGQRILWESAAVCPCIQNEATAQANTACPVCFGSGFEYFESRNIRAIATNMERSTDFLIAFGEWAFGKIRLTLRPEHQPGIYDRYTLRDSVMQHAEALRRQGGFDWASFPIAKFKRQLVVQNAGGEDVKRMVEHSVIRLRKMGADPTGLDEGIRDFASVLAGDVLVLGTDFDVTADGRIDWRKGDARGTAPKVGGLYSLAYYHHPRYIITEHTNVIRDAWVSEKRPDPEHTFLPVLIHAALDRGTRPPEAAP